jgi:hypothetical protein
MDQNGVNYMIFKPRDGRSVRERIPCSGPSREARLAFSVSRVSIEGFVEFLPNSSTRTIESGLCLCPGIWPLASGLAS